MSGHRASRLPVRTKFRCSLCGYRCMLALHVDDSGCACPECDHPFGVESVQGDQAQAYVALCLMLSSTPPGQRYALAAQMREVLQLSPEQLPLQVLALAQAQAGAA